MCKVAKSDKHEHNAGLDRRGFLKAGVGGAAAVATLVAGGRIASAAQDPYAPPAKPGLPPSNMKLDLKRTALVVTDPQVDFLSPKGVTWGVVGASVTQHNTVENIGRLFAAAKKAGITVAISPHYYYPTDKGWRFEGALEKLMHKIGMFDRPSAYSMDGFTNSGADFMEQYKQYIFDGKTIVTSPHKVYGPEANDLVLQLRKNRVDQVILAGMSANLCVEANQEITSVAVAVAALPCALIIDDLDGKPGNDIAVVWASVAAGYTIGVTVFATR